MYYHTIAPEERAALRARYAPAAKPQQPTLWQVKTNGVVVFENANIKLCQWFIKQHSLNTKPSKKK